MYLKFDEKVEAPSAQQIVEMFPDMFTDVSDLEKVHVFRRHPSRIKIEPENNNRLVTSIKGIKPDFKYTDPKLKKQVKVQYFVNTTKENIAGVTVEKYNPPVIYFSRRGDVIIDMIGEGNKDYAKLLYMLLHPKRMKTSDAIERGDFYYDDPERISGLALKKEEEIFKIQQFLLDKKNGQYIDDEKLIGVAMRNGINNAGEIPPVTLRNALLANAKANPKSFIEKMTGRHGHSLEMVQMAIDMKVLYYDSQKYMYHYTYRENPMDFKNKIKDTNPIYQVKNHRQAQPAQDFVEWLLEHDTTDAIGNIQRALDDEKNTLAMAPGAKQNLEVGKRVLEFAKGIQISG